jgi:prevent-host-death family protein
MPTVNMHEAKTQLSRLVQAALDGEEVVIARAGRPAVKLVPVPEPLPKRQFGILRGKVWAAPDAWDPMTEEELALWYDAPLVAEPFERDDGDEPEAQRLGKPG